MEKQLSSKIAFECTIFKVEEDLVEVEDGSKAKRWYVVEDPSLSVICVRNGKVILLKEYLSASKKMAWKLPSGRAHKGEDVKAAAIRESKEEVGLDPLDIKLFRRIVQPSPWLKIERNFFIATKFKQNQEDSGEYIDKHHDVHDLTFSEVEKLIDNYELEADTALVLRELIAKNKKEI